MDPLAVFFFLILIKALGSLDGEVSVLKRNLDLILVEAREIDVELILLILLLYISLHKVAGMMTVEPLLCFPHVSVVPYREIKKIVKKIVVINTREHHHKSFLLCNKRPDVPLWSPLSYLNAFVFLVLDAI